MADLKTLLAQKAELDSKIAALQTESRARAIAQAKALMAEYDLSVADVSGSSSRSKGPGGSKVAAKYRNPATGDSWTGRGLKPNWLKAELERGRALEEFTV